MKGLQKVKGGVLFFFFKVAIWKKNWPLDISSAVLRRGGRGGWCWCSVPERISLPTQRSLSALIGKQSPFLCSKVLAVLGMPFVDKKHEGLRGWICSYCSLSCFQLCDPKDCSTPGFPVLHHLLEFAHRMICLFFPPSQIPPEVREQGPEWGWTLGLHVLSI